MTGEGRMGYLGVIREAFVDHFVQRSVSKSEHVTKEISVQPNIEGRSRHERAVLKMVNFQKKSSYPGFRG